MRRANQDLARPLDWVLLANGRAGVAGSFLKFYAKGTTTCAGTAKACHASGRALQEMV
jgi:hypothetical protein